MLQPRLAAALIVFTVEVSWTSPDSYWSLPPPVEPLACDLSSSGTSPASALVLEQQGGFPFAPIAVFFLPHLFTCRQDHRFLVCSSAKNEQQDFFSWWGAGERVLVQKWKCCALFVCIHPGWNDRLGWCMCQRPPLEGNQNANLLTSFFSCWTFFNFVKRLTQNWPLIEVEIHFRNETSASVLVLHQVELYVQGVWFLPCRRKEVMQATISVFKDPPVQVWELSPNTRRAHTPTHSTDLPVRAGYSQKHGAPLKVLQAARDLSALQMLHPAVQPLI